MEAIIWLGVMIAFAVGEAVTVGLTSIWCACSISRGSRSSWSR